MEHIAALLLIVGCSGDLSECRELPAPVPVFETMEECTAALPLPLKGARGSKDAHVLADCVYVDPAMEEEDAVLEWDVTKDGRLVAEITADGQKTLVASSERREGNPLR
ncbi:MAG: hypothetical protein M9955_02120 [Rhizobiaceae bacterium]|nr:hypothetical protein [Rhizobiaceae bacterium]